MRSILLPLLALGLAVPATAAARSTPREAPPAAWTAYAAEVNRELIAWLRADDPVARSLRMHLLAVPSALDQSATAIALKLWIDADGRISKADYPPFADAQANADLRAILERRQLATSPPRGMLLPLRLEILVEPAPVPEPAPE